MARKEIVVVTDDLTGDEGPGVETVRFGLDSTDYEIDLGPANRERLHAALAEFTAVARRTGRPNRISAGARAGRPGERPRSGRDESKAIRVWWATNWQGAGLREPRSERGRVPDDVRAAYERAGGRQAPQPRPVEDAQTALFSTPGA